MMRSKYLGRQAKEYSPDKAELPEGWTAARLEEICTPPQYGWTTSADRNNKGLKLLRTTDISKGSVDWSTVPGCKKKPDNLAKYLLSPGDIVVSRAGSVGLSYVAKECPESIFASYLIRFQALSPIESDFIGLFLKSPQYWSAIAGETAGIAIPNVNASKLKKLEIPIPPLAEQKRIVAKVEELLARVNVVRERLAKVKEILKRFRQSVLSAACSGRLTHDWRNGRDELEPGKALLHRIRGQEAIVRVPADEDPIEPITIPPGWTWSRCEYLCDPERIITYGVIKLGKPVSNGIMTLRSSDVRWLYINENHIKRISPEIAAKYSRTFLKGGEIVVTVRGTLGGVSVVHRRLAGANISREVAVIPVHPELDPRFFCFAIASSWSQSWLSELSKGVTYTGINIRDLKRLPLPVPPMREQMEIARRVEALFNLADGIEKRVAAATERAEKLTQAILAKAFRGELVPTEAELARHEDRSYEAAPVLLERIRKAREEARPRTKKTKREENGARQMEKAEPIKKGWTIHV